jgi:DNA-binding response OmpR family regulator
MRTGNEKTPLILVAEDEADAAELLRFRLRRHGYQAAVAGDGLAALNVAFETRPDLLILDLMMPKLHGLEVCRLLKSSPVTQHIPILILSALSAPADKLNGFGRGADDYLTKPFEFAELLARVESLLHRSHAHHH